jgi:hypothetical protein
MLHDAASAAASTLTYLARIARRQSHARAWLARALEGQRLDELAESALEVTVETGDPIGEVLAEAVDRAGSVGLADRFLERPAELRDWIALALGHYLRASEETGVELDSDLFTAIAVRMGALEDDRE